MKRLLLLFAVVLGLMPSNATLAADTVSPERPPNIVYLMADELAYYELSHMGHPKIHTPEIDRLAAEGIRFTHARAGAPVCAPLRCALLTGKHMGHASVRANDGGTPLRAEEPTIASMLRERGYATGGFGKWGCGGRDSTGVPEKHGFDTFFGYYDQVHAHSYYPPYLICNSEEVPLAGNNGGRQGETYSHYRIMDEAKKFIRDHRDEPFFCYLPITPPHGLYDIPSDDPAWQQYAGYSWIDDPSVPQDVKNYAAMVTMIDNNLGELRQLLTELNLQDNTIVFFTGDNGGEDRFKDREHPRGYLGPNVDPRTQLGFRGGKRNLFEGGLRIPFVVAWPGHIAPGSESDLAFYHPDLFPTLADLTGATPPGDLDGISIAPTLLGSDASAQQQREYLYWEYRQQTAVIAGKWKVIRPKPRAAWQLFDLSADPGETKNLASDHPEVVAKLAGYASAAHQPVQAGTYLDPARTRHERDRQAKTGFEQ
ncbi:arylsulfatase [Aeoliella mucimassa]|uniref:Arylsulfatase n=1 Tax=Aeoliella mucimassa TaxID=2527972 RepID=A0A518AQZ9_9BACT|nr:arylsulfatase [Aeoliella mucimassa]QDU57145.1 Arylsulfatase [Aeoliella mucimassa]